MRPMRLALRTLLAFLAGRINAQQYANSLNSFYPGDNRAAIECIVARLPPTTPERGS